MGDKPIAIERIEITGAEIVLILDDGERLSAPLDWFPRLAEAQPSQRARWRLSPSRRGVHWPDLDEDLSLDGFRAMQPAPEFSRARTAS